MPMANVKHPGTTIKEALDQKNVTQREAARLVGVSTVAMSNLLRGHMRVSPRHALKIEQHFGLSAASLLYEQVLYDLAMAKWREDDRATGLVAAGALKQESLLEEANDR
jgi:addiction module HigA family antidote